MWTRLPRQLVSLTKERTALRWLPGQSKEPVRVRAGTVELEAIVLPASGRVDWTVYALAPAAVRAWCTITADHTAPRSPRAALTIEARHGGQTCRTRVRLDRRRWRHVRLRLPETFTGETSVTFRVDPAAAPGVRVACADVVLERRRPFRDMLRTGLTAARLLGVRGFLGRAVAVTERGADDDRYRRWFTTRRRARTSAPDGPLISVLTPVFDTDPVWLRACIHSVLGQTYTRWELILADDGSSDPRTLELLRSIVDDPRINVITCPPRSGIARATNAALAAAGGDFVAFLDHDDELAPGALAAMAQRIAAEPDVDVLYSDEDKIDPSGVHGQPHFKPDWSPELLMSCMYASHLTVMRRRLVDEVGGLRVGYEGSQDYDLLLRVVERTNRIVHVPEVLYHWRTAPLSAASSQLAKPWAMRAGRRALEDALERRHIRGAVVPTEASGHFRVRYEIVGSPRVSVIVTSMPRNWIPRAAQRWKETIGGDRIVEIVWPDASSSVVDRIARAAGDHLLLMHGDVEPCGPGWLDALLEFSQQPPIGAVAPFLIRRDGTIDHAGLVLGAGGIAVSAFAGQPATTRGHLSNVLDVRNCAALSGACLLTRRDAFDRVGGLDSRLPPGLAAIDYSLRLRESGFRLVVTPHARLWHARSCGPEMEDDAIALARLRERWRDQLDRDPFYNANFDRQAASYRLPDSPLICQPT